MRLFTQRNLYQWLMIVLLLLFFFADGLAQYYFGRNKVQYEDFDFQILKTDRFDVYFYPSEEKPARDAALMVALWQDTKFAVKHFNNIERLAIVGDSKWEETMAVFCKPFTTAMVRYFDNSAIDAAKKWVREPES